MTAESTRADPPGWDDHRMMTVVSRRPEGPTVVTTTRCATCGFTTDDEDERRQHRPRHIGAAYLRWAAARVECGPECDLGEDCSYLDAANRLRCMADEAVGE